MNVVGTLITVLRTALTLLVATSAAVMMDILWTLINILAMVCNVTHNKFLLSHNIIA